MADRDTRKTTPNDSDVEAFLDAVPDARRRADAESALAVMRRVTGADPVMWGSSIIGFGRQPYTTADGKQHEWFAVGLSPRKASLTLYGLTYYDSNQDLLQRLGPHTTGKGCVYVKRFDELDGGVFEQLVRRSWEQNHADG
ncbi:DUF1801 domain-containing protein [Nocardioides sp. GCM10027113]|uniref:DUF1801 domain-containing protein n=1 Tax=unclassified Nocardioides TaxID=2615069 RepID=UPI003617CB39